LPRIRLAQPIRQRKPETNDFLNGECGDAFGSISGIVCVVFIALGFFAQGMDGRIDNPNAGWKGKGISNPAGTRLEVNGEDGHTDQINGN